MKLALSLIPFLAFLDAAQVGHLGHIKRALTTVQTAPPPSSDPFYTAPANLLKAAPGDVLRTRVAPDNLAEKFNASAAYSILYRTTDSSFNATFAVTTLFVPANGTSSSLLSYQVAYDSANVDDSPSYTLIGGVDDISKAIAKGYHVAVPDYEGPLASFTAGKMSGFATLDGIRAVRNAGFGLADDAKYAMWGSSGGALASEWAAELQQVYAPELNFAGAVLGSLTPVVANVITSVDGGLAAGLIPEGVLGLATQHPLFAAEIFAGLNKAGQYNSTVFLGARNQSIIEAILTFAFQNVTDYFSTGAAQFNTSIAQATLNSDGTMGYHGIPQMPIFAYKAIPDEVSPVADTDALLSRYCGIGANILLQRNTASTHNTEYSFGRAEYFLASIFAGNWTHTGCTNQTVSLNTTAPDQILTY